MNRRAIYDEFDRATGKLFAYLVIDPKLDGRASCVGRLVFKHGARVSCYLQVWSGPMVIGRAGGGGYDRATAAAHDALSKWQKDDYTDPPCLEHVERWREAFSGSGGEGWYNQLRAAGYIVQHVLG